MRASRTSTLWAAAAALCLAPCALAQSVDLTQTSDLTFLTGTQTLAPTRATGPPTGPYITYTSRITLSAPGDENITTTITGIIASSSATTITGVIPTSSSEETGTTGTGSSNGTMTSSAPQPSNTQPCNGWVEFCERKYSNITYVGAHNSPFVRPGNTASNQELDVTTQLNDGIRFLQAQIQWPNNSSVPHFCHGSCDVLDAGPINEWLTEVRRWVDNHPYDVVTILLGNGNYSGPEFYAPYIEKSGIIKYLYTPPYLPMQLDDWPTLENMIIRGKRVIMFMDYNANQLEYPWLLDEFSQVWETPFDPLDASFPCVVQRPPDLSPDAARSRLYIANHNLNAEFDVFGVQLLVPAVSLLNQTNAAEGSGSAGLAANNCRSDWGRAPNVINVDYYNYGSFPGSVFEAAARVNNVTYSRDRCCGIVSAAATLGETVSTMTLLATLFSLLLTL
jgi:hypothetical protein